MEMQARGNCVPVSTCLSHLFTTKLFIESKTRPKIKANSSQLSAFLLTLSAASARQSNRANCLPIWPVIMASSQWPVASDQVAK